MVDFISFVYNESSESQESPALIKSNLNFMLYTRKGDDGKTKTFGCDQRISKSSAITEALGALDEINSFLGLCKIESKKEGFYLMNSVSFEKVVHDMQKNIFIIHRILSLYL